MNHLSWFDTLRFQLWLRRLERPVVARDRALTALFVGSLLSYWIIGQIFHQFHAHEVDNLLFGGDVNRVWMDLSRSHRNPTSGVAVSSAHPLFVFVYHPLTALLARLLAGADLTAALLVCHTAAALGVAFLYLLLRRCAVGKPLAVVVSVVFAVSTAQVIFGSTTETYSFIPSATLGLALLALSTGSPLLTAPIALLPFALNLTLLPYSLLCAPVVWLGRLRLGRWALTVVAFWVIVLALGAGALLLQHIQYPETNFFEPRSFAGYYDVYVHKPALRERLRDLGANFLGFSVVAPRPIVIPGEARQAGFVSNALSTYSRLGWVVVTLWGFAWLAATYTNLASLFRVGRERRALLVLCAGWMLGCFGLFLFYGVEMFLPSEFWTAHLVLWVGLGVDALLNRHPSKRSLVTATGILGLALLVLNQAWFLKAFVRNYYDGPLLSL